MKNHRWVTSIGFLGLLMLVALTLVGCEVATPPVQPPTAPPASTATSTATASPRPPTAKANTPTPTALRPTQAPTLAPTLTPAATHTQVPPTPITWENTPPARAVVAIAPENANRVVPLAQWGKGNIQDAAYSPDGKTLGIASSLGVYLYDSLTLEPIIFYPTPFSVTAIQFSPDGLTAAWGFANGTIEIRQAATGEILQTLAADQNRVLRIAYAADGHRLTAIQDDLDEYESGGMAYVWDLEKGEVLSSHEINFQEGFDLSLDGQVLAIQVAYSQPPQIALADVASWELIRGFHFEDYLYALTISPDGKQLAAVSYDLITLFNADQPEQTIRISDLPEYMSRFYAYECQIEADGPGWGPLRSAAYSPDGKMIVLGSRMDVVQIRRTSDGALLASFPGRASRIVFAPDGQTFTLLPGDGAIEIRRVGDGGLLQRISGLTNFRSVGRPGWLGELELRPMFGRSALLAFDMRLGAFV